jgi:hypothetical protein
MPKGSFDLKAWARVGAARRLDEIRSEMRRIQTAFPELIRGGRKGGQASLVAGGSGVPAQRKRFTMSAEAKRRISLAQKRRWRKIRAAKSSF